MSFAGMVPGVLGATIRDASRLPEHLPNATRVDPWTEATPETLLFTVPGIARYLVENGTTITVEPAPDAPRNAVELFLHGSARGTLIHQRGELPLEATTLVAPNGGAVALSGFSGSGKSTIAAELCRRGWSLISDDITRVTWARGRALAWPSHDALKLWKDACNSLEINTEALPRVREGLEKFQVKMPAASAPTVLRAVIRLQIVKYLRMVPLPADRGALTISESTFRWRQIAALRRQKDHETIVQQTARLCRVMILNGAREYSAAILADHIARAVP